MLSKLLKYDFSAVLKYWWIGAVTSVGLAVVGGVCISILSNDFVQSFPLQTLATLGILLVALGLSAFGLLSQVLVYVRYYKNFFTDEGYLTFTLPVKRSGLLSSKLITAVTVSIVSGVVLCIDLMIMLVIGIGKELFSDSFWQGVEWFLSMLQQNLGGYLPLYIMQGLLLFLAITTFSYTLLFACITFAGIVVRKYKALAAIGVCYAASMVISFVMQWVMLFGVYGVEGWLIPLPEGQIYMAVSMILSVFILFVLLAAVGLYTLNLWMLDRHLNLS